MPLFRDDQTFSATLAAAGERLGMPAGLVEKDYWLTQVLRGLEGHIPGAYIFKGGTSLSKAFSLIKRFSEDLDILLLADGTEDVREALLERAVQAARAAALADAKPLKVVRGVRRTVRLDYARRTQDVIGFPYLRIDLGLARGVRPYVERDITALVGDALRAGKDDETEFDDLLPTRTLVLHPGRTLAEKLSLLHSRVFQAQRDGAPKDARLWVRHYYDVHALLHDETVRTFCEEKSVFLEVVAHAEEVSRTEFPEWLTAPRPEAGFGVSPAFAEDVPFAEEIGARYTSFMNTYYWGPKPFPTWETVRATVRRRAHLL